MSAIVNSIKKNSLFFLGYFLFVLCAGILWMQAGHAGSFLLLNRFHTAWLDQFFIYYTFLGDGLFTIILAAICWFVYKKKKLALALVIAFLLSGLVAQIIKYVYPTARPETFFSPQRFDFFIDSVIHAGKSSMPSGHTATAFATAVILITFIDGKKWQYIFLLAAILLGFSRIYLSQHFLLDVVTGSVIGILSAWVTIYMVRNIDENKLRFKKASINNN